MANAPSLPERALDRRGSASIVAATVVSGLSGYVVLLLAARTLDKAANADFLVFWGLTFTIFGALIGIQSETTRAVYSAARPGGHRGARVLPSALAIGVMLALALLATAPAWNDLLGSDAIVKVVALALGTVVFAGHVSLIGALSGRRQWPAASLLVGLDATIRLLLVALVASRNPSELAYAVAVAFGSVGWIALVYPMRRLRAAAVSIGDVPTRLFARRSGSAIAAAASSAVLLACLPLLVRSTSSDLEYATAAPLLLAVALTRGPLMIPLGAFQSAAITHIVQHRDRGLRAFLPIANAILVVGAVGVGLAAAFGPWFMELIRHDYRVDAVTMAGLTVAAVLVAILTLTGATCLAFERHRAVAAGWIAATFTSLCTLAIPADLDVRVVVALLAGPLVGIVLHAASIRGTLRADASPPPAANIHAPPI